jgi:hypothetical protein
MNPGDIAPSQNPKKNLAVAMPAKFWVAAKHISHIPQTNLFSHTIYR